MVGISISTRPDCINEQYLDFLEALANSRNLDINIELGLQTVNYHTLHTINRGHTLAEFIDAVQRIKRRNFEICGHIILNLPWDNEIDVIENAKILSAWVSTMLNFTPSMWSRVLFWQRCIRGKSLL
ncbi:hypothetical protein N752_18060 [Desulforamulus aquiferis]|nr:hypothetical protein N752_18060 [Desulforamulus aquiferis]